MSVTFTALDKTPQRLRLLLSNPEGTSVGSIVRTDANGTRTLRVENGTLPSTDPEILLHDYEYAMVYASIVYTAYDTLGVAIGSITIPAATERAWSHLTVPLRPEYGLTLAYDNGIMASVVTVYDSAREAAATVHQIVGRADPVVVLQPMRTRTGRMEISCPSLLAARSVGRTLSRPYVFMLRQSDQRTLDLYFVPTSGALTHSEDNWNATSDNPRPERRWTVSVDFTEVRWPTGYVVPVTAWTYNDVAVAYADYNALNASFATYADLLDKLPILPSSLIDDEYDSWT